jgi:hypothetical protein
LRPALLGVRATVQPKSSIPIGAKKVAISPKGFTRGESRLMFNPNQAFLLVQKLEIGPKCFTLGVESEIVKIFLIQATTKSLNLMALYWPQG